MLLIKPNCEHCNKPLPPDATEAMICSYECTFCCDCVANLLDNVCPNCGGGFSRRPIRPRRDWRPGVSLQHQPASTQTVLKPVDRQAHDAFKRAIVTIAPEDR